MRRRDIEARLGSDEFIDAATDLGLSVGITDPEQLETFVGGCVMAAMVSIGYKRRDIMSALRDAS